MALHPGDFLNQYRIESLVARSGMASIYKATDMFECSLKFQDRLHVRKFASISYLASDTKIESDFFGVDP